MTFKRIALSSLALFPGALIAFVEPATIGIPVSMASQSTLLSTCASLGGLAILFSSRKSREASVLRKPLGLLRRKAAKKIFRELPTVSEQRETLNSVMKSGLDNLPVEQPETPASAVARVLTRALQSLGASTLTEATDQQIQEIFVLYRVLNAGPGDAGRLAQAFRIPSDALAIRDELIQIAEQRIVYERQRDTFEATRAIWMLRRSQKIDCMTDVLDSMATPDPELWHHIVSNYDLNLPAQEKVAFWCLNQESCDRATLAMFLRRAVTSNRLTEAARTGDNAFLQTVKSTIAKWPCAKRCEIALDAAEDPEGEQDKLVALIEDIAKQTGDTGWKVPQNLYAALPGRPAQSRDHWRLDTGTMVTAPKIEDYVDFGQDAAAPELVVAPAHAPR